jgi:hypothetical protein
VTEGISDTTSWIVSTPLTDKTTHWWRVRALDVHDAASAWSAAAVMYVSTGPYQPPTIQVTTPATIIAPQIVVTPSGNRKQVTLNYEGTDLNIDANVALYYGTDKTSFTGNLIVDGLRQTSGTHTGTYVWDVTNLSPGAYYVYGMIYDPQGVGKAYAAGAVVIANPQPTGTIVVTTPSLLATSENGTSVNFTVKLGSAPTQNVVVNMSTSNPREGVVQPSTLTFTPQNYATAQQVTLTGQDDCIVDLLTPYRVLTGPAVSLDPNYFGVSGPTKTAVNADNGDTGKSTNTTGIHICAFKVVKETRINSRLYEYVLTAQLTNSTTANVRGVNATLRVVPSGVTVIDGALQFGAVNAGDQVRSTDTFTIRSTTRLSAGVLTSGRGFAWNATVVP